MSINTVNCIGDGDTDVTACLQQAIDNTEAGDELIIPAPSVAYLVSGPLNITKSIRIVGNRSLIQQITPGTGVFSVTSSNVTLKGLVLAGHQYTNQNANEVALAIKGPSALDPLTDIDISDCAISSWGMYGIHFHYVNGFCIRNCSIANISYAGIMGLSVSNGTIAFNSVNNVVGSPNAYGIALSRTTTNPMETVSDPCCQNVVVAGNRISNVPHWEALDAHGGIKIVFVNNVITKCQRGIAVVSSKNDLNVPTYPPRDCVVANNVMDSGVTDGSAVYGIVMSGAAGVVGMNTGLAEGCSVIGNTIRGYGFQSIPEGTAMYLVSTRGLTCQGNVIVEPGKNGITLYYNNYGFTVSGNVIQDVWSNVYQGDAINVMSDYNRGFVGNNSYVRGNKEASNVLNVGLNVTKLTHNWINITKDYSDAAVALYDPGHYTY